MKRRTKQQRDQIINGKEKYGCSSHRVCPHSFTHLLTYTVAGVLLQSQMQSSGLRY